MPARSLAEILEDLRNLSLELEQAARSAPAATGFALGLGAASARRIDRELRILRVRRQFPQFTAELARAIEVSIRG